MKPYTIDPAVARKMGQLHKRVQRLLSDIRSSEADIKVASESIAVSQAEYTAAAEKAGLGTLKGLLEAGAQITVIDEDAEGVKAGDVVFVGTKQRVMLDDAGRPMRPSNRAQRRAVKRP